MSIREDELIEDLQTEIKELRELIDIAYDHLLGAGYERDGITLQKLEAGCTKVPNVK